MKPNEQRIALARWMGWTNIRHNPKTDVWYGTPPKDHKPQWDVVIPDYADNLNAMHVAEKKMQHYGAFVDTLAQIQKVSRGSILLPHATSKQRLEAILRTLNLWQTKPAEVDVVESINRQIRSE